ncbi:MAG: dihydropteroate synthase [Synergistaceae bacterium]|jgi:dihydropteroate synthase|nr:dihydropteroate synthase [Synergistaceae bacterium]
MGILNVTGDSFFPPSRISGTEEAVRRALAMVEDGADILDIGAESTRPGALPVPECEEIKALIPVVEAVRRALPDMPISVDTRRTRAASLSLEAGADIVNDVSGLDLPDESRDMLALLAVRRVPYVLMHTKGTPDVMQISPCYKDLFLELMDFFERKIELLTKSGVSKERIILDPGVGFGKRCKDNLEIIARVGEFKKFGLPILIGVSRKGFIGKLLELGGLETSTSPENCMEGTLAVSALCAMEAVEIVRVHDVRENRRVIEVADAIRRSRDV